MIIKNMKNEIVLEKELTLTGEGIVWKNLENGERLIFKTKDERHAKGSGKIKTFKPVDEEFENKKRTFVNEIACISWRLEQMYKETQDETIGDITIKQTGDFLRKVINDVIKEESDLMVEQGLEPKSINGMVSKVARSYFMSRLDEDIGL